jgi:methylenetetrahydrofolate reductase (NADPH)
MTFASALQAGRFVVTTELNPPKGTDLAPLFAQASALAPGIDAFNLTDSHSARMAMTPWAVAHLLRDRGIETIVQMTGRDRNRIALQADMLAASALGIGNLVFMGGDPPANGDHPDARGVFELLAVALLRTARTLEGGTDLGGNPLKGAPTFCLGAVVNPGADDLDAEVRRLEEKVEAGADFVQSQAVYDIAAYERFARRIEHLPVAVLAGIIPLKSIAMARWLNEKIPGIDVPEAIIRDLSAAPDFEAASIELAARTIRELQGISRGVHIMAIGWESRIPEILSRAGCSVVCARVP